MGILCKINDISFDEWFYKNNPHEIDMDNGIIYKCNARRLGGSSLFWLNKNIKKI